MPNLLQGPALRHPQSIEVQRPDGHRDRDAGYRHRREHRHFQHRRHLPPAPARPFRNPEQWVALNEAAAAPGKYPFAGPDFIDWKKQNHTFQDMILFGWTHNMNLSSGGRPESVHALPTEANHFALPGVSPLIGRTRRRV